MSPEIKVPDFRQMASDELHKWEFTIYEHVAGDAELAEIIGKDAAQRYYDERGKRIDTEKLRKLKEELRVIHREMQAAQQRLAANYSGKHYFGGY